MFIEYDWTYGVYRLRFGQTFIDWRGIRSWESLADARASLAEGEMGIIRKCASRSWEVGLLVNEAAA